jgi:D-sedoheptulose 7-phosphate isomerase
MKSLQDFIVNEYNFDLYTKAILIADHITAVSRSGRIICIFGNGGSASDAQHWAAELVCTYGKRDRKPYPALALTTDTSILTAWSNDFDFNTVFCRQIEAFSRVIGLAIGLSTSGTSRNVLLGLDSAASFGAKTILITGSAAPIHHGLDHIIRLPSVETPTIQTLSQMLYHEACGYLENT